MRWNVVLSKNFWSARYLKLPPVIGARMASSVISKSPQLVDTVETEVLDLSSFSVGFLILPTSFAPGFSAFSQPLEKSCVAAGVSVAAGVAALSLSLEEPQPASSAREAIRTAR